MSKRRPSVPEDPRGLPAGEPRGEPISIELEGQLVRAFAGEPVAAALWAAEVRLLARSPKFHRPRGAFCFAGHCASCAMRVDGRPNVRACLEPAREGLRCERQNAFPDAQIDVLRAADWLFPQGMDHHHLMTGTRIGNELFVKLVREMGGTGLLPDAPVAERPPVRDVTVDVCVVGGGPAGLSAARALAGAARVLLVDEQSRPGGSWLAEPGGVARADALTEAAAKAGVRLETNATAIGFFPEDVLPDATGALPGTLAVATRDGLLRVAARRYLYATGTYEQNLPFPDADRPDVIAARGCGRLAFRWGILPGRKVTIVEDAAAPWRYADRLATALDAAGVRVARAQVAPGDGGAMTPAVPTPRKGVVAVAALPAPAFELARHHGAEVRFDASRGGFAVVVDEGGATTAPGVFAAGDVVTGAAAGPDAAERAGEAVGLALARSLA